MTTAATDVPVSLVATVEQLLGRLAPIAGGQLKHNTHLVEIGIDSLTHVELANEIKVTFDMIASDEAIERFEDILAFVRTNLTNA